MRGFFQQGHRQQQLSGVYFFDDGIILELKVDDTPEAAIAQIRDRKYMLKFQGKMAERKRHTGRVLLVGIGYDKKKKDHHCRIEVVQTA